MGKINKAMQKKKVFLCVLDLLLIIIMMMMMMMMMTVSNAQ